jgi:hypothetical protein
MSGLYSWWINRWERRLASRDTNRKIRPFEWGLEWFRAIGWPALPAQLNGDNGVEVERFVDAALGDSEAFYAYQPVRDYRLKDNLLTFTSPVASPWPENNTVHAGLFRARRDGGRAVLVLPQWNAGPDGHVGLCRLLNRFGITALRMSLAYHDRRMPPHLERADYHVSSNIGRTVHAGRQSVIDARACLDWLAARGYQRLGILGTSLGSCIAFIAAAHDARLQAAVYNHISMYFGDVVWTGLSTNHVRLGLGGAVSGEELRRYWSVISPACFLDRMRGRPVRSLLIWSSHDTTFLPEFSRQVVQGFRARGLPHKVVKFPCGHYTLGQFPFNIADGMVMCNFLRRTL